MKKAANIALKRFARRLGVPVVLLAASPIIINFFNMGLLGIGFPAANPMTVSEYASYLGGAIALIWTICMFLYEKDCTENERHEQEIRLRPQLEVKLDESGVIRVINTGCFAALSLAHCDEFLAPELKRLEQIELIRKELPNSESLYNESKNPYFVNENAFMSNGKLNITLLAFSISGKLWQYDFSMNADGATLTCISEAYLGSKRGP